MTYLFYALHFTALALIAGGLAVRIYSLRKITQDLQSVQDHSARPAWIPGVAAHLEVVGVRMNESTQSGAVEVHRVPYPGVKGAPTGDPHDMSHMVQIKTMIEHLQEILDRFGNNRVVRDLKQIGFRQMEEALQG